MKFGPSEHVNAFLYLDLRSKVLKYCPFFATIFSNQAKEPSNCVQTKSWMSFI